MLNAGLHKHQRLALLNALTDRRLRGIVSSLGINPEETKVATHILKNMRSVLMRARMKSNRHAKVTKARRLVAKTLLLATVQSPESMTKDNAAVTKRKFTDTFGIS